MSDELIRCENVSKSFSDGSAPIRILEDVSICVSRGDLISICGKSGSGKSTLLHILSSLLRPDCGSVLYEGRNLYSLSKRETARIRQEHIGFVFQDNLLLEDLSVRENVMLPIEISGKSKKALAGRALDLAKRMGIAGIMDKRAALVSSGEKARVSLLRAVCADKSVVFLDEPTGALDNENARTVEDLIMELSRDLSIAFVYVTHDMKFASRADRRFTITERRLLPFGRV